MVSGRHAMMPRMVVEARRALVTDAAALVRLRAVMFSAMGHRIDEASGWEADAEAWFADRLGQPDRFAAFVVDDGDGPVSVAAGLVIDRAPSPTDIANVRGYVFNVATEPAHRRRGYGNACLAALLRWYAIGTPVRMIDLTATDDGGGMYRAHGFRDTGYPSMRLRLPD